MVCLAMLFYPLDLSGLGETAGIYIDGFFDGGEVEGDKVCGDA